MRRAPGNRADAASAASLAPSSPADAVVQAPMPRAAHQRRPIAGEDATPTTGTPSTASAMSVPHTGTPRRKFAVPSIGSMIHCRVESPSVPNSSPRMPSRGRASASRSRMARSTARSASVTGVRSGFVCTSRSTARNRASETASARSASSRARSRSSAVSAVTTIRLSGTSVAAASTATRRVIRSIGAPSRSPDNVVPRFRLSRTSRITHL